MKTAKLRDELLHGRQFVFGFDNHHAAGFRVFNGYRQLSG